MWAVCVSTWQTNQKHAEYHLRVILVASNWIWRNSDACKLKKTPATISLKAFREFREWKQDRFDFFSFPQLAVCHSSLSGFLLNLKLHFCTGLALHLTLERLRTEWTLQRKRTWPSTGSQRGNGFCSFPLFFLREILVCWKMPCGSFKSSDVCN